MALKANTMSEKKVIKEEKVEVKESKSSVQGDKPFEFVKDEHGRLSIRIKR